MHKFIAAHEARLSRVYFDYRGLGHKPAKAMRLAILYFGG